MQKKCSLIQIISYVKKVKLNGGRKSVEMNLANFHIRGNEVASNDN